jgi:hypothetical protein
MLDIDLTDTTLLSVTSGAFSLQASRCEINAIGGYYIAEVITATASSVACTTNFTINLSGQNLTTATANSLALNTANINYVDLSNNPLQQVDSALLQQVETTKTQL